jgi:tetratricopeptide (TPR) repeat protein
MRRDILIALLLLAAAFTLATLVPAGLGRRPAGEERGLVHNALGESRRLIGNHFFVKADAYMHSGYYPSIFDAPLQENHMASRAQAAPVIPATTNSTATNAAPAHGEPGHKHEDGDECPHCAAEKKKSAHVHDEHCDHDHGHDHVAEAMGRSRDWIDAMGRRFIPDRHTHADERGAAGTREILPWLRLAADLDPHNVEAHIVTCYWLRSIGRNTEAVQLLREGLRNNPGQVELLFELGHYHHTVSKDRDRARQLLEFALVRWQQRKAEPDTYMLSRILGHLSLVEYEAGNFSLAIAHLQRLKQHSPFPADIQRQIDEIKAGANAD